MVRKGMLWSILAVLLIHALGAPQLHALPCPETYVAGAMKCATSSLYVHLQKQLVIPRVSWKKELAIFGRENADTFLRKMKGWAPSLDATPYLASSAAPMRIKTLCNFTNGPPKFVISLCDPAERAWSHFRHEEWLWRRDSAKGKASVNTARKGSVRHAGNATTPSVTSREEANSMLVESYVTCIETFVPKLKKCFTAPNGTIGHNDCFGQMKREAAERGLEDGCLVPLAGSVYKPMLDRWLTYFPREDFLILYKDEWLRHLDLTIDKISLHFGMRRQPNAKKPTNHITANRHGDLSELELPQHVQDQVKSFFEELRGWEEYIDRLP
ncbi:hypothetical protein FVE85_3973 [Porphyridium purpureum]|uniref:Sulfotransferase n=1 Tax=Porphyridium purpureum TaxID=35688 RepID=A0A5J4YRT5_PORPP|nr:hypothetical protein FVE85_3973 [Porphyridium purpureum]|eukprot:POR3019..scf229_5